jgi:di/tricarboxylate transporter
MAVPGLPVQPFALLLVYSLGLMGVLSPYATGPAPVYYASGFVSRRAFWSLGLLFGLIYLATLLAVGIPHLTAQG